MAGSGGASAGRRWWGYQRYLLLLVMVIGCAYLTTFQAEAQPGGTVPVTGAIRVIKQTQPATTDLSFSFTLRNNGLISRFALRNGGRKFIDGLTPGKGYRVNETVPAGWIQSQATCNDGSPVTNINVRADKTVVCTFVNVKLGKLTINLVTAPATDTTTAFAFTTGGGLTPATFELVGGGLQTFTNVVPGSGYRVNVGTLAGWAVSSATCSNGSTTANLKVDPGQNVTCTFTAVQQGKLIVRKVTTPNPDLTNTAFAFTAGGGLAPTSFALKNTETQTFANLAPRSGYTLSEQPSLNWRLASALCDNNSPPTNIQIDPGQTVTCTFRNEATFVNLGLTLQDDDYVAEPGDTILYTLSYGNSGNQDATGATITTQVPANTTFVGPTDLWSCAAGAGAGTTCTYAIGTLAGGVPAGQVQFKVKVNGTLPANVTQVDVAAQLGYSAQANAAQATESTPLKATVGLSLRKDDDGISVRPGELITYTLVYSNSGTQAAASVTVTETVPAHTVFVGPTGQWSCPQGSLAGSTCVHTVGALPAANGGTVDFIVRVDASLPSAVTLVTNQAYIGQLGQPNADLGTEQTELAANPDLAIQLSDGQVTVAPGEPVLYRLNYLNQGNQAADGVVLTMNVPANSTFQAAASTNGWQCNGTTCRLTVGALASGGSGTVDFTVQVNRPLPAGVAKLTQQAQIADDGQNGEDANPANNVATEETPIVAPIVFTATKRDALVVDNNNDGLASPGDTLEYTMILRNDGGMNLRQLTLADRIGDHLRLIPGVTTSQGTVTAGNGANQQRVGVDVGELVGAGGTATIKFRVVIEAPLAANVYTVHNQATISSPDFGNRLTDDPDTAAARDTTETTLDATVKLQATLRDTLFVDADQNNMVSVGDTLVYALALENPGLVEAGPLSLLVPLDANVTLVPQSVTTSLGEVAEGGDGEQLVQVDLERLPTATTVQASFQVQITKATSQISHQAVITFQSVNGQQSVDSDDPDTTAANDATVTTVNSNPVVSYRIFLPAVSR